MVRRWYHKAVKGSPFARKLKEGAWLMARLS